MLRRDVLYPVLDRLHIPRPARNSGFHCFRHSVGSFVNAQTGNLKLTQSYWAIAGMRPRRTSIRIRRQTRIGRPQSQLSERFSANLFVMFVKIRTTRTQKHQLTNDSKLVKEMICHSQIKEERTLTDLALSVHMDKKFGCGGWI